MIFFMIPLLCPSIFLFLKKRVRNNKILPRKLFLCGKISLITILFDSAFEKTFKENNLYSFEDYI